MAVAGGIENLLESFKISEYFEKWWSNFGVLNEGSYCLGSVLGDLEFWKVRHAACITSYTKALLFWQYRIQMYIYTYIYIYVYMFMVMQDLVPLNLGTPLLDL